MANQNKILVVEVNGSELDFQTELLLVPVNIPFSDSNFTATDLQQAVVESNHFSYKDITSGRRVIVPSVQQMLLYQVLTIDDGELDLAGEVVIL
jgi:hypothetical protein